MHVLRRPPKCIVDWCIDQYWHSGANTDLLGRRWFLVIGNLICTVGHIVVASAKNGNSVIVGMAIAGFGGANCQV